MESMNTTGKQSICIFLLASAK